MAVTWTDVVYIKQNFNSTEANAILDGIQISASWNSSSKLRAGILCSDFVKKYKITTRKIPKKEDLN